MLTKHVDFRYTNIAKIRDEGLTSSEMSDANVIQNIKFYSNRINRWTAQWFFPVKDTMEVDGSGQRFTHVENILPILELDSVAIDYSKGTQIVDELTNRIITGGTTTLKANQYETVIPAAYGSPPRIIRLVVGSGVAALDQVSRFPHGANNISIEGTFGWLEQKTKVSTTISENLTSNATSLDVADASNIEVGDVVRIGDSDPFVFAVVTSVSGNTLNFDSVQTITTVSSGAACVTYGKVPDGVEYVCRRLVIANKAQIDTEDFSEQEKEEGLTGEKIGDYSYTRQIPRYNNASITGIRQLDQILSDFSMPSIPHYV